MLIEFIIAVSFTIGFAAGAWWYSLRKTKKPGNKTPETPTSEEPPFLKKLSADAREYANWYKDTRL